MAKRAIPRVLIIGETRLIPGAIETLLAEIGAPEWQTDAETDGERLVEVAGRLCYKSFGTELNPNITRVRQGNTPYIYNLLREKHGSVLEHVVVNIMFLNVSRIFTHELVRHRSGTAFAQESLRYKRLDEIDYYLPPQFAEDDYAKGLMQEVFQVAEQNMLKLAAHFKLDDPEADFPFKKLITSAMRRLAPEGLVTNIAFSANIRELRHILTMRTAEGAEIEMREVIGMLGEQLLERYPAFFQDFVIKEGKDGVKSFQPEFNKV